MQRQFGLEENANEYIEKAKRDPNITDISKDYVELRICDVEEQFAPLHLHKKANT